MIVLITIATIMIAPPRIHAESHSTKVGHLSGSITFVGKLPQVRKFNLATYPDPYYCGRVSDGNGWRIGPKAIVSTNSRFAGAIVYIKGLNTNTLTENRTTTVKSLDCRFTPFISLLRKSDVINFENWDPVLHQIEIFQATSQGGRLLLRENVTPHPNSLKSDFLQSEGEGIHEAGPTLTYEVHDEGVLLFRCPIHEYMEAWALSLSHHYVAVSDKEGKFSISDIPTGTYTLVVWHPIGQTEQTIYIRDQDTLQLNLDFQATRSTFYREPEVKRNPFGIELLGDSQIIPSVELQKE
ncbi:MAG: hypothetical protein NPIRA04_16240 [Nitrospirales bacterium]|nr:MAG: hypothetical protein NPIRA04_16240 [Nitrospirales bacterium]